jgi:UDP-N-acetylglucosamine 2-epimerase (non-hydrolysing)
MKCLVVLGTRPEIIKLSPVIREMSSRGHQPFVVHTGQHYSSNMDEVIWQNLALAPPSLRLSDRSHGLASQTAAIMQELQGYVAEIKPDWMVVHGDTNSTLAGALVAAKQAGVRIAHVEAGLRSFDRTMPEEVNRVVVDHLADLLFAPTSIATQNLRNEGIQSRRISLVGNTIEDVVQSSIAHARDLAQLQRAAQVDTSPYALLTLHRAENTASLERLEEILRAVFDSAAGFGLRLLFPVHPRTRQLLESMSLQIPKHVEILEPMGYFEFLALIDGARIIATDSGGLQEEACLLGRACVTLRENTERPETVTLGCNILAGVKGPGIMHAFAEMMTARGPWKSPYGGGLASKRIVDTLEEMTRVKQEPERTEDLSIGQVQKIDRVTKIDVTDVDSTVFRIQADATAAFEQSRIRRIEG